MFSSSIKTTLLIVSGVAVYILYMNDKIPFLKRSNNNDNKPENKPPSIDTSDREIFYGKDKKDYLTGYSMPDSIIDLQTQNNLVLIATKPQKTAFNQEPKSGFMVKVDKVKKTLIYTDSDKKEIVEQYDSVKDKIILLDKKYLSQKQ